MATILKLDRNLDQGYIYIEGSIHSCQKKKFDEYAYYRATKQALRYTFEKSGVSRTSSTLRSKVSLLCLWKIRKP